MSNTPSAGEPPCVVEGDAREPWSDAVVLDEFVRTACGRLFALCQEEYRNWLSEGDLQCLLHAELRDELQARGLPPTAVHANYALTMPLKQRQDLDRQTPSVTMDLVIVAPHSIGFSRGRRWVGEIVAAVEVKRGYERAREVRDDLAKLVALREAHPSIRTYLVIMGYRNLPEQIAPIERAAARTEVTLLSDNYWGHIHADQLEIEPTADGRG
jgi:hypothetical protein